MDYYLADTIISGVAGAIGEVGLPLAAASFIVSMETFVHLMMSIPPSSVVMGWIP